MSAPHDPERLRPFLERVLSHYNREEYLRTDPLSAVYRYRDPRDREAVGFVAAGLAFGNVKAVRAGIDRALAPLGSRPARTLAGLDLRGAKELARGFVYRWVPGRDLAALYVMLGAAFREAGGLEPLFAAGMTADEDHTRPGAAALVQGLAALAPRSVDLGRRGTRTFLPQVNGPAASKLN
jgi:hypothetical protein